MVRLMKWMIGFILTSCSTIGTYQIRLHQPLQQKNEKEKSNKTSDEGLYDLPPENDNISTSTIGHLLEIPSHPNCTEPSIYDFPPDMFTQAQRVKGGFIVHVLLGLYACYALAAVCDIYFVPSLQILSEKLGMSSDVAGATFMAAGTSSPELFESIIGSFITEGDIGVGTIVGSAVFNVLAVTSVCGLVTGMVVPLNWWPLTRDCAFYAVTVVALVVMISDEKIYWYESVILLSMFVLYVIMMYFNRSLAAFFESRSCCSKSEDYDDDSQNRVKAEENISVISQSNVTMDRSDSNLVRQTAMAIADDALCVIKAKDYQVSNGGHDGEDEVHKVMLSDTVYKPVLGTEEKEEEWGPTSFPKEGCLALICWLITWPVNLIFYFTIPNCNKERWKNFYPLTFLISVVYIGALSYFVAWMVTVIGYTIGVPDTVMGITFLAIGTSVPEGYSSIIVCRQGFGNMAISNSVGSNIFDILFCLGLPWLIKAAAFSDGGYVKINSGGLVYSTMSLLAAVVLLYLVIAFFKFKLNLKVGITCLILYSGFLTFASLVEMNVFGVVNPPPCE